MGQASRRRFHLILHRLVTVSRPTHAWRHPVRVRPVSSCIMSNHKWTFDAGSPDEQARWIALIKGAVREANGNDGTGEEHEVSKR